MIGGVIGGVIGAVIGGVIGGIGLILMGPGFDPLSERGYFPICQGFGNYSSFYQSMERTPSRLSTNPNPG